MVRIHVHGILLHGIHVLISTYLCVTNRCGQAVFFCFLSLMLKYTSCWKTDSAMGRIKPYLLQSRMNRKSILVRVEKGHSWNCFATSDVHQNIRQLVWCELLPCSKDDHLHNYKASKSYVYQYKQTSHENHTYIINIHDKPSSLLIWYSLLWEILLNWQYSWKFNVCVIVFACIFFAVSTLHRSCYSSRGIYCYI